MSIDHSEVGELARDLHGADGRISPAARAVVKRGGLEIKRGMQREFSGHRYAGAVPGSLEFEVTGGGDFAQVRVGELNSDGPQWGLAAILAYGTSNNAPNVDHVAPLHREVPAVLRYLGEVGEDAVLGGSS